MCNLVNMMHENNAAKARRNHKTVFMHHRIRRLGTQVRASICGPKEHSARTPAMEMVDDTVAREHIGPPQTAFKRVMVGTAVVGSPAVCSWTD